MGFLDGGWHMNGGWGWWMLWGWLSFFLFWGGIIALVVWAVHRLSPRPEREERRPSPLDIARERLARGEISKEEYEEIRRVLMGEGTTRR